MHVSRWLMRTFISLEQGRVKRIDSGPDLVKLPEGQFCFVLISHMHSKSFNVINSNRFLTNYQAVRNENDPLVTLFTSYCFHYGVLAHSASSF